MKKETKKKLIIGGIIAGAIGAFFAIRAWKNLQPYIETAFEDFNFDEPSDSIKHDSRV
jgi:isochorismate hydrolase